MFFQEVTGMGMMMMMTYALLLRKETSMAWSIEAHLHCLYQGTCNFAAFGRGTIDSWMVCFMHFNDTMRCLV